MGAVIPLYQPAPEPAYMEGTAVCLACAHECEMVAPIESQVAVTAKREHAMECPACHSFKLVYKRFVFYEQIESRWTCTHCDGVLFTVMRPAGGRPPCVGCATCGCISDIERLF